MVATKNKRRPIVPFLVVLVIGIAAVLAWVLYQHQFKNVTSYTDSNGNYYQCTKPLKAKLQTYNNSGVDGSKSYVPVNSTEITKYCHQAGVI
jgi:predicted negative regulator of RcsB-dependent stress response